MPMRALRMSLATWKMSTSFSVSALSRSFHKAQNIPEREEPSLWRKHVQHINTLYWVFSSVHAHAMMCKLPKTIFVQYGSSRVVRVRTCKDVWTQESNIKQSVTYQTSVSKSLTLTCSVPEWANSCFSCCHCSVWHSSSCQPNREGCLEAPDLPISGTGTAAVCGCLSSARVMSKSECMTAWLYLIQTVDVCTLIWASEWRVLIISVNINNSKATHLGVLYF